MQTKKRSSVLTQSAVLGSRLFTPSNYAQEKTPFLDGPKIPADASKLLDFLASAVRTLQDVIFASPLLPCLLVGGFPRNLLMGLPPTDADLVIQDTYFTTFLHTLESAARSQSASITWKKEIVLKNLSCYGLRLVSATVTFRGGKTWDLDIREIRSSIQEDARARDFTCNAIYLDPVTTKIIDTLDGVTDIQKGVLRPCSDLSAVFNHSSRWIRAFRFQEVLGLKLSTDVVQHLQSISYRLSEPGILKSINAELDKILSHKEHRWSILEEMVDSGFLEVLGRMDSWAKIRSNESKYLNIKASAILLFRHLTKIQNESESPPKTRDEAFADFTIVDAGKVTLLAMLDNLLTENNTLEPAEQNVAKVYGKLFWEAIHIDFYTKLTQLALVFMRIPSERELLADLLPSQLNRVLESLACEGIF
jgi:tRNA nucleotidyltransferase/poly(A) polymerase